jgi:hypothetical protein
MFLNMEKHISSQHPYPWGGEAIFKHDALNKKFKKRVYERPMVPLY